MDNSKYWVMVSDKHPKFTIPGVYHYVAYMFDGKPYTSLAQFHTKPAPHWTEPDGTQIVMVYAWFSLPAPPQPPESLIN